MFLTGKSLFTNKIMTRTGFINNAAIIAAVALLALPAGVTRAAIGSWKAYMAYHNVQQIREAGKYLFVLASNNLYQYNTADQSITTYDKVNGLSDTHITNIEWSRAARRLIAVYSNSNIDLVDTDGNVTNISDLYSKSMTEDKTVNSITVSGADAYLATNFGAVKVNMERAEISETYNLGLRVSRVAVSSGRVYVRTTAGAVWAGAVSSNLIDRNNWSTVTDAPAGLFDADNSAYEKYHELVETLNPGGPHYNSMGFTMYKNGRLYTVNGGTGENDKACVQVLENGKWTVYENDIEDAIGHRFLNLMSCDVDPKDPGHVFAGGQTGLYEYRDGKFVKEYTYDNSPLKVASTVSAGNKNYVIVPSVKFDAAGNLWLTNSISPSTSLLELTAGGEWIDHHDSRLMVENGTRSMEQMNGLMFDSRGLLWFGNNYWNIPALIRYAPSADALTVYRNGFTNQDGVGLTLTFLKDVTEDRDGNLWFGTSIGPLYITAAQAAEGASQTVFNQFKVPRNDGSNLADYLLNNTGISAIAIDGANRKWFGTSTNGVYLISADNMTQIHHFTTDNSPLLSNNVMDIAIDDATGEVFFGTEFGLCSYMSDATAPAGEMDKDNVYAYPNPVEPGYTGLITVTGLSFDADVKVTTATGHLVAQGRSNGGTFTWDGRDSNGRRVASGVYNIVTAKSDGSRGTVCKVAVIN